MAACISSFRLIKPTPMAAGILIVPDEIVDSTALAITAGRTGYDSTLKP